MDFDKVIEEWAIKYKPISHIPGETSENKRFFLVENIVNVPQLAAGISKTKSPCVAYEFHQEGTISGEQFFPTYVVSILVRADTMKLLEKERSNEAVKEAMLHGRKLIAWLNKKQEERQLPNLDLSNIPYGTLGPLFNNWYAVFFTFRDTGCVRAVVDPHDYNE